MLPDQIDLSGCRQSTAIVNGLVTTVFIPIDDRITQALDSIADNSLLDRWILGTHKNLDAPDPDASCWTWRGTVTAKNYGLITVTRSIADRCFQAPAHVVAWAIEHGTVPRWALIDGRVHRLVLDHACCGLDANCPGGHTCRHRRCQNVRHLELVSNSENVRRGKGRHGEKAAQVAAEARRRQLGMGV
nr:HNH endonuclease [Streptomyces sp. NBC_00830]